MCVLTVAQLVNHQILKNIVAQRSVNVIWVNSNVSGNYLSRGPQATLRGFRKEPPSTINIFHNYRQVQVIDNIFRKLCSYYPQ